MVPGHDRFERQLRDDLGRFEVPYNSADWQQMDRALTSGVRGWTYGRALTAGVLVACALLIGATAYFMGRDEVGMVPAVENVVQVTAPIQHAPEVIEQVITAPVRSMQQAVEDTTLLDPVHSATLGSGSSHPGTAAAKVSKHSVRGNANGSPASPSKGPPADATILFRASANKACPGTPVDFTVANMPQDGIYLWNFGDGSFSNRPDPQHTFTKPGQYNVMLSVSSASGGAIHNKPSSEVIVVYEPPMADFSMERVASQERLPSIHFKSLSEGEHYHWNMGDGTTSTMAQPDHLYHKAGTYLVELTVTNENGCVDRKVKEVHVDNAFDLGAPSSFSPNGDGIDDTFMPARLLTLKADLHLAIYDTAGVLVYSTHDPKLPWTGTSRIDGTPCAAGDHIWVVDVSDASRSVETFTGKVRLVR